MNNARLPLAKLARRLGFVLLAGLPLVAATESTQAANQVKKTGDTCRNAHAILTASEASRSAVIWEAISRVVKARPFRWKAVPDYEPGVSQKVSFRQYETRFHEGGIAYVAHCGAGQTCNDLAAELLQSYPEMGSPGVFCGAVPHILDNPTAAPGL